MKRLISYITLLLAFLLVAFWTTKPKSTPKAAIPQVGILQLMSHPALDEIHRGIIAGLKSGGYQNGRNLKIVFENAQGDQSNLKTMSSQLIERQSDLVVGIATPAAQALANAANGKTPVILAGISDPVGAGFVKSLKHPGGQITGTSGDSPARKQLALLRQLLPKTKKIGIIYTSSDSGGQHNAQAFAKVCRQENLTVQTATIANSNDMQQVSEQLAAKVDVIYAPQDNGVASAIKTLVKVANQEKIPVFASADTMVKDGALAAYAISQFNLGKKAGQMAAQVLHGKKPGDLAIATIVKGKIVLNEKQAKLLQFQIPKKVLQAARKNGEVLK